MGKTTDSVIFSDAEQEILELSLQNPTMSNAEIAEQTGYRLTLIRDTRREYEDDVDLAEDVAEASAEDTETTVTVDDDLSEVEQVILDLVAEDPQQTNAEIAAQTGARLALVRDTRSTYSDHIDTTVETTKSADAETDSTDTGPGEPSPAQQEILTVAAENPSFSNADIATETGSRITLVRDTLDQYDGPATATQTATVKSSTTESVTTGGDLQTKILETAQANPALTNGEIAEKTGARITLVRDTIRTQESDGEESDSTTDSDDKTDVLADVDTQAFSGTQLRILEAALSNPALTNSEIADQTETRITLVRDTIYEHEYDEKPWAGTVEEPTDDSDDERDDADDTEIIVDDDDEVEIPDTTAADVFNDRQRAILEAALENPELTNGEIAEQTGARLTLVRDTRATYESGVELAESDDSKETTSTTTNKPTFSKKQKAIIAAAEADEEATIAEIADQTNSRITLVRDTLAAAEDSDVDTSEADAGETQAASVESATADADGGVSDGVLVALVIAIILLVGVAVLVL